ncbi:hypothetical protein [Tahibacter sp.]|uniref:hypothetical protein n=1 Tax=Tahibacter sp. TaxID=2056211 RepID=UPI0028C3F169|nr:hypothetical protein [Tahibacter sp.]
MRILRAGFVYFFLVFGAGFALALIRIPFLVPRFGVRTAELIEAPVMLLVILWASRYLARRNAPWGRPARLAVGCTAFVLLVAAELGVAYFLGARSPGDYLASRDPISGSVYLASLVFFAVAPALWGPSSWPDQPFTPTPSARQPRR